MVKAKTKKTKAIVEDQPVRKRRPKTVEAEAPVRKTRKAATAEKSVRKSRNKAEAAPRTRKTAAAGKWTPTNYTWPVPEGMTTSFPIQITFRTEKDGLPGGSIEVLRFKGRYDPNADESKIFNLSAYDQYTVQAVLARLSMVLFHATGRPNSKGESPRLKPNTTYRAIGRVGIKKADDTVTARISSVEVGKKTKREIVFEPLDNKSLESRKIRKVNKYLPAAFRNLQELPERTKRRRKSEEDED